MTFKKEIDVTEIKKFIEEQGKNTKIYLGCDSERFVSKGQIYADYILVVVIHKNGKNGCKIFGEVQTEVVYDKNKARPAMRLMTEAYKVAELYAKLAEEIDFDEYGGVEIHLDINPNKKYGSSCVIDQAVGYIKGVCNIVPMVKPQAFAASYGADRYKEFMHKAG